MRRMQAEYEKLRSQAARQRTALEMYSKAQNNNFKTRISQIYREAVSLKIQLYALSPEESGIKDTYNMCKQKYDNLEGELRDLLKQANKMVQAAEEQKATIVESSDQNNDEKSTIARFEESLQQQSDDIDSQVYFSLLEKLCKEAFKTHYKCYLCLDLSLRENAKFLKSMKSLPYPDVERITVRNVNSKNLPTLKTCLLNSSLRRLERLDLHFSNDKCLNKSKYLRDILNVSYKVNSKVYFYHTKMRRSSLMKLLSACRNKEELLFSYCYISMLKVPNFGHSLDGSKIKTLRLENSTINGSPITRENMNGFTKLVEGLSKSQDFRETFKHFKGLPLFNGCKEVKEILIEHGFHQTCDTSDKK
ncbi:unnamed protein product [Moneuplotes crassus]|uniref:Uncharacterized protein n=1 Tax=Euplotes crassus TaxID=5936 RepID=A0AAD1UHS4_EUPCR|nr:unnamed protein product [Moneuplotes crassus]